MKVDLKSQLGIYLKEFGADEIMLNHHIKTYLDPIIGTKMYDAHYNEVVYAFTDKKKGLFENYVEQSLLLTDTAQNIVSRIKINEDEMDFSLFSSIQKGMKKTVLLGNNLCFRYITLEDSIMCVIFEFDEKSDIVIYFSFILVFNGSATLRMDGEYPHKLKGLYYKRFLQTLIFLEFSEAEFIELQPNRKYGQRKTGKVVNDSNINITIVNKNWNVITLSGVFSVSGHFRLQPYGHDRAKRRLIFIEEFTKGGYTRTGGGVMNTDN